MAKQIGREHRLTVLKKHISKGANGVLSIADDVTTESLFNEARAAAGITDEPSQSALTSFRGGLMDDRGETFLRTSEVMHDGKRMDGLTYWKKTRKERPRVAIETFDALPEAQRVKRGVVIPVPADALDVQRGRRSVNPLDVFGDMLSDVTPAAQKRGKGK